MGIVGEAFTSILPIMLTAQITEINNDPFDLTRWTTASQQLEKVVYLAWAAEALFELMTNHRRWPQIFPWLAQVTVDNSLALVPDGLGSRRVCHFGNGMVLEEVIVGWLPPQMYAYASLDENHPFGMREHLSLVWCESQTDEFTRLRWQHYFHHANPAAMCQQLDESVSAACHNLIQWCGGRF